MWGASIRINDSLQEGSSRFYAEITRLRKLFDLAGGDPPLLFLLDELLQGTNSNDRRIGAEGVVRALLNRGAIGLVSTHDLALAEIGGAGLLRPVYHGENGIQTLKELARSYLTISKDLTRVMNRVKALYRSWGISCAGTTVYGPRHRSEWLSKITEAGVYRRAEFFYQQLDALQALRQQDGTVVMVSGSQTYKWVNTSWVLKSGQSATTVATGGMNDIYATYSGGTYRYLPTSTLIHATDPTRIDHFVSSALANVNNSKVFHFSSSVYWASSDACGGDSPTEYSYLDMELGISFLLNIGPAPGGGYLTTPSCTNVPVYNWPNIDFVPSVFFVKSVGSAWIAFGLCERTCPYIGAPVRWTCSPGVGFVTTPATGGVCSYNPLCM